eukprot:m.340008 g.340008  ORF g.340008 m.340008 type:complete len:515 (-) comp19079_c0_seq1:2907-4451(-)
MVGRWVTLLASIGLESVCGTSYAYSVYSGYIKNSTGFSQKEINSIASVGNVGLYLALIAGIVFDKYGPIVTISTGVVLLTSGYLLMWNASEPDHAVPATVGFFSFCAFLWSNGASWLDTVAIAANVRNFPNDRGRIVGLLKSFFGLSASIVTIFYTSLFKPDGSAFLLFLGCFTGGMGLLCIFFVSLVPSSDAVELKNFEKSVLNLAMSFLTLLAIYILTIAVLEDQKIIESDTWTSLVILPIVSLQAVVLYPAFKTRFVRDSEETAPLIKGDSARFKGTIDKVTSSGSSIKEIVLSLNFWILQFVVMCGTGAGLTFINNLGQHVEAISTSAKDPDKDYDANVHVVTLSVANCYGRLFWGYCTDKFPRINRCGWLAIVTLASGCGMFAASVVPNSSVMYGVAFWNGISYGGYWAIMPAILADLYGTKWFAVTYSLVSLAPALGGYVFSVELAGALYDYHREEGSVKCYGIECYELTYQLLTVVCAAGFFACVFLSWKTRVISANSETGSNNYKS